MERERPAGGFMRGFRRRVSPAQIITAGFVALILLGTLLLNLPLAGASGESIGFVDALFTATSATCVTGLVVEVTSQHWSAFGKVVLLALIQLGGLGFITVYVSAMVILGRKISLRNRMVIQTSFNQDTLGGMVRFVKRVMGITFMVEGIGAVLLAIIFFLSGGISPLTAAKYGVFHSISSFCNAGFDIIGPDSLAPYSGNVPVNIVVMSLIVLGGLGFPVLIEISNILNSKKKRSMWYNVRHLSLQSKLVFTVTGALILLGTLVFALFEWNNPGTLGELPTYEKLQAAAFQSVTLRTCGYFTIDQGALTEVSKVFSLVFMLIGGSSAGTAGGMKVVTVGVIALAMLSVLKGRNSVEGFGRTIPIDILQKALTVACAMIIVVFTSALMLHFTEAGNGFSHTFLDLLFESASAAGTVGVTTGITPFLTVPGRIIIVFCMFLGRLSPITVVVALNMKLHNNVDGVSFPEERVIIG